MVLAYAQIAAELNTLVQAAEWPGPNMQTQPIYKVPLTGITWLAEPQLLDAALRSSLDAFKGKAPDAGWSWLVQTTHRLTAADFRRLTKT